MRRRLKIGDWVARKDVPEIRGTVVALRRGEAKVYWPIHTTTWVAEVFLMISTAKESNLLSSNRYRTGAGGGVVRYGSL